MRALVLEGPGRLVFHRDRPEPEEDPAANCLRVRVVACGICGSDLPRAYEPGGAYRYPLVLGHEFSGVVEEDGHGFRRGDRVAVFPLIPQPGQAFYESGDYALTSNYDYFGSRRDGGMQEVLRVPAANLFRVPEGVDLLHAACVEPASVALHGVRKLRIRAGDTGLVLGGGPIGNMTAQWLRIHGCARVLVSDIDRDKLEVAKGMGFEALDAAGGNVVEQVKEMTGGEGAARVVEACGLPQTLAEAVACAAPQGEVVFMGNLHGEFRLGDKVFSSILRRELTLYGTWNSKVTPRGADDWTTVLKFMGRELQIGPLVTDTPELEEGAVVFEGIRQRKRKQLKTVFRVTR